MNKIISKYLIFGFLKSIINIFFIFMCLGLILNLFEEIEFFKNLDEKIWLPLYLTFLFIPNLMIELLPFIIFISAVWYFMFIKSNTDLLSLKIFGYSNLKIILTLSFTAFLVGCCVLFVLNPLTAAMTKSYEITKAKYSRDIDHLVSINKNGVWIKDSSGEDKKIISAKNLKGNYLYKVSIYKIDKQHKLIKRIESEKVNITKLPWVFERATVFNLKEGGKTRVIENYKFDTIYDLNKLNSIYRNLGTISFIDLVKNYKKYIETGYKSALLKERLHFFLSLPIFLFFMVFLASIFTVGSVNKSPNIYYIFISIISCVVIYYLKDLSLALGQTERISLTLSAWAPIVTLGLFCTIGIIQINEK
tara:strand:+ start:779 stop:1864 length:1086 start_codon:yes stop_codon:yes gene_type:complete